MRTPILLAALLTVSLLPTVGASFTDVREWSAFAVSFTDSDGVFAATSFSLNSAPHGFAVASRTTSLQWTAQITSTPASPGTIDEYAMTLTIKEGATTRLTCNGVSFSRLAIPDLGRFQSTFLSFCQATGSNALVPGTTYTYETAVTMVSGTNHIVQTGQSLKIQQTDSITDATLDGLATTAFVLSQNQQTRALLNVTNTTLHSHLNLKNVHLSQVEANLTALFQDFTCDNCTIETFEPLTIVDFPGFTDEQVGGLLLFLAMLVIAYFQRWLFVAIASVIGVLDLMLKDANGPAPIIGFEGTLAILVLGLVLEVLRDIRDGKDKKGTDASLEE